ncbi:MAG: putative low-complexity protein [Solimicrobium sp.]|jgi:uncharacterized protein YjbI with pentapeptide repeats|nr:putative low-complexity protein [Solimicrobium sp.]
MVRISENRCHDVTTSREVLTDSTLPDFNLRKLTMQSVNRSVSTKHPIVSEQTDVINLNSRIGKNRTFIEDLKANPSFQNLLILMQQAAVPKEQLLKFLTGRASLEECWGEKKWMTNLIIKTYGGLKVCWANSHFLSESLAATLTAIFNSGYFESAEKSHAKMGVLMGSLKRDQSSETLDLVGADLSGVNLSGADLSGANFSKANLSKTDLSFATLPKANLTGANLSGACLYGTNLAGASFYATKLSGTDLSAANLCSADLSETNLSWSFLSWANLSEANLSGADLSWPSFFWNNSSETHLSKASSSRDVRWVGVDLSGANLFKTNLSRADLSNANLAGANLSGAMLTSMQVEMSQLLGVKLIGAESNNDEISAIIKKQEREETFKRHQLLSQIVRAYTFEGTPFPVELIDKIGGDLI